MTAPLSVVIPVLNAASGIGPCLAALSEGAVEGLVAEVILVDGGSEDAIAEIADAVGARLISAARGRGPQLAAGAEVARAPWLLFLHADTALAPGWPAAMRRHMSDNTQRAGYAALRFDDRAAMAHVTAGWANLRSALFALPYGDQGLLIHRDLYGAVGGYPPFPILEDVAIVRKLGRRRLARLDTVATTSADRYRRDGWLRRGWRNITTVALFLAGTPPDRLAERYRRR
ncbi:MAG: TIGR04283 family arsenosugar biosynthesis glycosyltransferase [Paracoccaceae bacterium]